MLKKFLKLNNKLDNYHLIMHFGNDVIGWELYKKYDDPRKYFDVENKPIMTSAESDYKDLVKFVKTHRRYDITKVVLRSNVIISIIIFMICILNIFLKNDYIRGFVLGADLILIFSSIIIGIINEKNFRVSLLEYKEEQSRNKEEII